MAGTTRLELATSCVTGMRSNQTELRSHIQLSFVWLWYLSLLRAYLNFSFVLDSLSQTELRSHIQLFVDLYIQISRFIYFIYPLDNFSCVSSKVKFATIQLYLLNFKNQAFIFIFLLFM